MVKGADGWESWFSPSAKINVVRVEVTDSARELANSHLSGPTAGLVVAEALAGVALLGGEWTRPDETVTFRMGVPGPLRGLLVEAAADGALRGYSQVKVMNDLDVCEELDASAALGEWAEVQIIRSVPGKILSSGSLRVSPASVTRGIEEFCRVSLQRQVLVQTSALAYGGFIDGARGVLFECLPDGSREAFEQVGRFVEDGTVAECLEAAASTETLCATLGLRDAQQRERRPLRFACRCSAERVTAMLAALPSADIQALVEQNRPAEVFCHMCGRGFTVGEEQLRALLDGRA